MVFNLFEGLADFGSTEAHVAGLLEWLGIPFTGSPYQTLCLARSKHLTKHLLQRAGLPTPDFFVVEDLPVPPCPLDWPVIVKPALQDASVGLDQGSVVTTQDDLNERVAYLLDTYGPPVLVEQFIRGREFNVAVIEAPDLRVLPISEILFIDNEPGYWPIVTYDAKWKPGSRDYEATPPRYPADGDAAAAPEAGDAGRAGVPPARLPRLCPGRFPRRATGKPYILEVNPNPDFSPTAGLAGGLVGRADPRRSSRCSWWRRPWPAAGPRGSSAKRHRGGPWRGKNDRPEARARVLTEPPRSRFGPVGNAALTPPAAPPASAPREPPPSARRRPNKRSTAGRNTSADGIERPTPSVRMKPSPARPRSVEIISVPKPIIVVRP